MKIDVYNLKAEKTGQKELSSQVFGFVPNQSVVSQAIRVFTSNQRKAHARAKTRGEVAGTTKKIWAQKGTGRARHGDNRAPIFVGGGTAHGPQGDQNYKLKISKKMAKIALKSVLSDYASKKLILTIDSLEKIDPKTKKAQTLIGKLRKQDTNLNAAKKIAIIVKSTDINIKRSIKNIPNVNLVFIESLNPYTILQNNYLIFNQNCLDILNQTK